jgi:hypothetical protein
MGVYGRSCEPPDRAGPSSPPHPETVQSEDLNQRRQLVNLAVAFSQRALSPFTARPTGSPGRPKNTGRSGLSNIPARWLAPPRPSKRAPRPPFMARHPGSTLDDNHRTCRAPTDVRSGVTALRRCRALQVQGRGFQNEGPGLVRGHAHQPRCDVHLLLQIGRQRLGRCNRLRQGRGLLANADRR